MAPIAGLYPSSRPLPHCTSPCPITRPPQRTPVPSRSFHPLICPPHIVQAPYPRVCALTPILHTPRSMWGPCTPQGPPQPLITGCRGTPCSHPSPCPQGACLR